MKIGYLFPVAIIVAGVALLVWFIASGLTRRVGDGRKRRLGKVHTAIDD